MTMLLFVAQALAAPPAIDAPLKNDAGEPAVVGSAPDDAAVVIGNETYANLRKAPHAQADAGAFAVWATHFRGIPADRVHSLTDASAEDIRAALTKASEQAAKGTLFVFFAGQGGVADGKRVILGADTEATEAGVAAAGIPLSELATGGKRVVIADAGFSGIGRDKQEIADGLRFTVPAWPSWPAETVVWTGTTGQELPALMRQIDHGMFAYFAIGALRGWADGGVDARDKDRDGIVTVAEAEDLLARGLAAVGEKGMKPSTNPQAASTALVQAKVIEKSPDLPKLYDTVAITGSAGTLRIVAGEAHNRDGAVAMLEKELGYSLENFDGPFQRPKPGVWIDADGKEIGFEKVKGIAATAEKGREAIQRLKNSKTVQAVGGLVGTAAAGTSVACGAVDMEWCSVGLPVALVFTGGGVITPLTAAARQAGIKLDIMNEANAVMREVGKVKKDK